MLKAMSKVSTNGFDRRPGLKKGHRTQLCDYRSGHSKTREELTAMVKNAKQLCPKKDDRCRAYVFPAEPESTPETKDDVEKKTNVSRQSEHKLKEENAQNDIKFYSEHLFELTSLLIDPRTKSVDCPPVFKEIMLLKQRIEECKKKIRKDAPIARTAQTDGDAQFAKNVAEAKRLQCELDSIYATELSDADLARELAGKP